MPQTVFLCAHAAAPEWHDALDQCVSELERKVATARKQDAHVEMSLGWCYLTDYFAPAAERILETLQDRLPGVAWVGAVGIGVAASGIEYMDEPALVLMLSSLPRTTFRLFSGRQPLHPGEDDFTPHTALVHADGGAPDLQDLLRELSERTATNYLFGGLPSGRTRALQIADEVFTGGLSGVAFDETISIVSRVTQGCEPVGPSRTVTRAEDNLLIELDARPALACVQDDLGLRPDLDDEAMANALSSTLVGVSSGGDNLPAEPGRFGPDTLVRHIVGLDPRAGVLAIADEVEQGAQLAFCKRSPTTAMADLIRITSEIRHVLDNTRHQAVGAIYVSCTGRGGYHFGAPHAELRAVRNMLGDVALAGFFANGEIARDRLYGYTGVLTVFATPIADEASSSARTTSTQEGTTE